MDDLIDVIVVLGVLLVGILGGLILLIKNAKSVRKLCLCCKKKEIIEKSIQRRTIRVVRKAGTIHAEPSKSVAEKTPVSRIFSNPLPTPPSATKAKEFVYIMSKMPSYKIDMNASHPVASPQTSLSTTSSYLPSQLPSISSRRGSF